MDKELNFLIYNTPDKDVSVRAVVKDESIWLTQKAMAELFGCSTDNISLHLKNIFSEGELDKNSVTEKISATASDGKKYLMQFYNLDAIISVGYRVNSRKATNFRIWATGILKEYMRRITRSSAENRAKESLIVDFINQTALDEIQDKASVRDAFYQFAQREQKKEAEELIREEQINEDAAKRYILTSLKKEYASENGTGLNEALPKMSPLNPKYHTKKQNVFKKISAFVEKFKRIGGAI